MWMVGHTVSMYVCTYEQIHCRQCSASSALWGIFHFYLLNNSEYMLPRHTPIGGLSHCSPVTSLAGSEDLNSKQLQFHVLFIACVPAVRSLTCIVQYTIDSFIIKTSSLSFLRCNQLTILDLLFVGLFSQNL